MGPSGAGSWCLTPLILRQWAQPEKKIDDVNERRAELNGLDVETLSTRFARKGVVGSRALALTGRHNESKAQDAMSAPTASRAPVRYPAAVRRRPRQS